jgi:hypothetical protein
MVRGTFTISDGTVFSGEWGDVQRGTINYSDGRSYEGEWGDSQSEKPISQGLINYWEDLPHGLGTMVYPDGRRKEGIWRKGKYVGIELKK